MVTRTELNAHLQHLLQPQLFQDYCPNGLQVEGKFEIKKIVTGVTACYDLLQAAINVHADAVLVHHGYFWRNETPTITGIKRNRLKMLIEHDINLFAYHLPLDAHAVYGNNVQLGECLGFQIIDGHLATLDNGLVYKGKLPKPMTGDALAVFLQTHLQRAPLYIPGKSSQIHSIAWCTGASQHYISQAIEAGVDAYLTGEISEQTVHIARETGIHFFAAGHHATERFGVNALGTHLAHHFGIEHEFIDIDNPV